METARVIYFPVKWFPPYLVMQKLEEIQMEINHTRKQIEKQCANDKYNEMLRKQNLINIFRSKIHLVKNHE